MKPTIALRPPPARIRKSKDLLAVSAVTYLALGIALGVHAAFYIVAASIIIALWAAAARRFPALGWLTGAFVIGFIQGLFGRRYR